MAFSKQHAELVCDSERVLITDLSSRNGTFVNGRRLQAQIELNSEDILRVGDTLFVVECGQSRFLRDLARTVARGILPVIVQGEMGTGKDRLARYIHEESGRSGPFVAANCARFEGALAESALFGHAQGAFTGATKAHEGLFVSAHEGTLFLDEIAELGVKMQAVLLRAVQTKRVLPVGSTREVRADVRLIVASNTDLDDAVCARRFRADLLSRFDGRFICIPPLRHHRARILAVILELNAEHHANLDLTMDAAEALLLQTWPSNVRGVEMFVLRAREDVASDNRGQRVIHKDDLPALLGRQYVSSRTLPSVPMGAMDAHGHAATRGNGAHQVRTVRKEIERHQLEALLIANDWNVCDAARRLGLSRKTIQRWIKRHGLRRPPTTARPSNGKRRANGKRREKRSASLFGCR